MTLSANGKRLGRPTRVEMVDGQLRTLAEAAGLAGICRQTMRRRLREFEGCSMQAVVDMTRAGALRGGRSRRFERHLIGGEWLTIEEIAARTHYSVWSIRQWRTRHRTPEGKPGLMADFVEWTKTGGGPRGPAPKAYRYEGREMTIREAAQMLGVSYNAVNMQRHRLGSFSEAVDHIRTRQAQRRILAVIEEARLERLKARREK